MGVFMETSLVFPDLYIRCPVVCCGWDETALSAAFPHYMEYPDPGNHPEYSPDTVILPDRMQYARLAGKIWGYCRKQLGKLYIHPQLVRCTRWQITMYYQVLSAVVPECV